MKNKKFILGLFVGVILTILVGVSASNILSSNVTYKPENENFNVDKVDDALNHLYSFTDGKVSCVSGKVSLTQECGTEAGCVIFEGFPVKKFYLHSSYLNAIFFYDYEDGTNKWHHYDIYNNTPRNFSYDLDQWLSLSDNKLVLKSWNEHWLDNKTMYYTVCK